MLLVAQLWFRIPFAGSYLTLYCGSAAVPAGGGRHRPAGLGGRRDHAAGDALFDAAHHAVLAALGPDHAASAACRARVQYFTAINPLRYAIDITRRVYLEGAGLALLSGRSVAAGADRRGHAVGGLVDVQPANAMKTHGHVARPSAMRLRLAATLPSRRSAAPAPSDLISCRPRRRCPITGRSGAGHSSAAARRERRAGSRAQHRERAQRQPGRLVEPLRRSAARLADRARARIQPGSAHRGAAHRGSAQRSAPSRRPPSRLRSPWTRPIRGSVSAKRRRPARCSAPSAAAICPAPRRSACRIPTTSFSSAAHSPGNSTCSGGCVARWKRLTPTCRCRSRTGARSVSACSPMSPRPTCSCAAHRIACAWPRKISTPSTSCWS